MSRKFAVGIDIGTYQVKVLVSELVPPKDMPKILGVGFAESKGLRHGYIIHGPDATRSVKKAIGDAERSSGIKIKKAFLSVGGVGLGSVTSEGNVSITRADKEITNSDVELAVENSQNEIPATNTLNRKVIHKIPLQYKIDGKAVLGKPNGMKGSKLEVKTLFVTCLEQHLADLIQVVEDAGVEVVDVMASPLAASVVALNKAQKVAGCVLANIGSETLSVVVYENNLPISLEVFPIGSSDITNDIALGLRIPLDEAEQIKIGRNQNATFSKKKLDEIVYARLSDMFELIESHLKKIGKNGMLPAGIIITGGGSSITTIEDIARAYLKLPSKLAQLLHEQSKVQIRDAMWAVAYGLCVIGLSNDNKISLDFPKGKEFLKNTKENVVSWFKQLLP